MNSKEILQALHDGHMSAEEAELALNQILDTQTDIEMESNTSVVDVKKYEDGIYIVTMQDYVHKNTFSMQLITELTNTFEALSNDLNCKVVILTGYDSYFASGGTKETLIDIWEGNVKFTASQIYCVALNCKVPVIAAMQGHAIGAGWSMGMFCDFPIMSKESIYVSNYMNYGFTPGAGATLIFPERFGSGLAQEILVTGKRYQGYELANKGISYPVLPRKEVLPYALELAKQIAKAPRIALVELKAHLTEELVRKLPITCKKEVQMHEKTFVKQDEVKKRIDSLFVSTSEDNQSNVQKPVPKSAVVYSEKQIVKEHKTLESKGIAIIGIAGQFPKASDLDEFWNNLCEGKDCITEIPKERWNIEEFYDSDTQKIGKTYCKWMGVLEDADKFSPLFFGLSKAEAELMDPQQRIFLENCWNCLEDAGLTKVDLDNSKCGVFVGAGTNDYLSMAGVQGLNAQGFVGNATSILAARISYLLNLKGPALTIDTACSSALVAISEACNNLVLHNTDLALAGGVYISPGPTMHIMTSKTGMLSPEGKCYTFDSRANGFVPGEGCGVVLLKRLEDAIQDKDHIYGVISGWGVNQDGRTNGITAPSTISQATLEKDVYQRFNINPETISYIETHGTGTQLGDPIEVEALTEAFSHFTNKESFCALGSVKSNIGHLLSASGAASVLKVLLALKHKTLPPTINFKELNPHINLSNTAFYINDKLKEWKTPGNTLRRAAVSSFGFSGTNAHIVIDEYLTQSPSFEETTMPKLFILSAKKNDELKRYAQSIKQFIENHTNLSINDITYTSQVGRNEMPYRLAIIAKSNMELINILDCYIDDKIHPRLFSKQITSEPENELFDDELLSNLSENQEETLTELARLWLEGYHINWHKLYKTYDRPQRISMPTYPFTYERYWHKGKVDIQSNVKEASSQPEQIVNLREYVRDLAQKNLRQEIDDQTPFSNAGVDSLIAINMQNQIKEDLGITIQAASLIEDLNSLDLTRLLEDMIKEQKSNGLEKAHNNSTTKQDVNNWIEI